MIEQSIQPHILFSEQVNQSQVSQNPRLITIGISLAVVVSLIVLSLLLYRYALTRAQKLDLADIDIELYDDQNVDSSVRREILEEARRRFDDEINRRSTLESKLGIVFALDGAIVALLGSGLQSTSTLFFKLAAAFALVSAGLGLLALRQYEYQRPGSRHYYNEYIQENESTALPAMITDLKNAYENNRNINNKRFQIYLFALLLSGTSLLLISISLVADNIS
ncbi:hypothetical protein [Haloarcula sp. Atlit-47R]|uniref:hypothetical protein n=1 Tax=Haloarcula sp. Atlit-47R TaxID=2282132 RepID=UPI0011C3DF62|nr:hypothetical protein [Haloarcula sp. Atlit-47R]